MALKRFVIDGFGQLELNNVFFRRSGSIEAQCFLDPEQFADVPAENGMLLAVDRVNRLLKMPVEGETDDMPIALNYTTEHIYDERKMGLKDFAKYIGEDLPRMGYPSAGELWTTNCFAYDDAEFDDDDAVMEVDLKTTAVYGAPCELGVTKLTKTKPEGFCLKAVEKTTMPDGQFAFKFQVIKA